MRIDVIMNGVTGRMGLNQHLVRSILAIREQGGIALPDGERLIPDPILVGRSEAKLRDIARAHGLERVSTDLDACLANPADAVYFDATLTSLRAGNVRRAIAAGKHVYCEKPLAPTTAEALDLVERARRRGVKHGIVQDKLFLPGIRSLKQLVDSAFFGRVLSVRGEFGYWVFEGLGTGPAPQRPSWNYKKEEGGGIILDMFAHWRYVLDHLFGEVRAVQCRGTTLIPERVDEQGRPYPATAEDAAYATFVLSGPDGGEVVAQFNSSWGTRVYRDDLLQIQVDGTEGSAVAGLRTCKTQRRANTPRAVWNPDVPNPLNFYAGWEDVTVSDHENAFKAQWELFLRHVVTDAPFPHGFVEGAKGVQLAELGLQSWREGRWIDVPPLETSVVVRSPSPAEPALSVAKGTGGQGVRSRVCYAAAHVACDTLGAIDWDATLAYRHHLWSCGLGVAEAMDTAQRGSGLDWGSARELIRRSLAEAGAADRLIACGAGTDHLDPARAATLDDVRHAYEEQIGYVERHGGRAIVMASRVLAATARGPDDYRALYAALLRQVSQPVILHWLGPMFDSALAGYWGCSDLRAAMDVCLDIIREHTAKIDGIKLSLLDADLEIAMRRRLPAGVRMYTGDDLNYDRLILGDERGHSDALLGVFDAIAPAARAALEALERGDVSGYRKALEPTVPLARHLFQPPTSAYKTGIVFLAYVNGHQSHFRMLGGAERRRSAKHLRDVFRLASAAGLIVDPEEAMARMEGVLALAEVD